MFRLDALVNANAPTTQSVLDIINGKRGARVPVPVVELLDGNLAPKNVLPGTAGNDLTAAGMVVALTTRDNATAAPRCDCDLILLGSAGPFVDESTDYLLVSDVELDPANLPTTGDYRTGTTLLKIPAGIYSLEVVDTIYDDSGGIISYSIKGFDPSFLLTQLYFESDLVVPVGLPISTALQALLRMDSRSPSEGGRTPSGVPYPGSPQAALPIFNAGRYTTLGIVTNASPFTLNAHGNYQSPAPGAGAVGPIEYNPYGGALADASTYFPLSPVDGKSMSAISGLSPTYFFDTHLGLFFRPGTGEFFTPFHPDQTPGPPLDPYKNPPHPLPTGLLYKQVDQSAPPAIIGTIPAPLSTWGATGGYDYDGSGPFYVSTTAAQVTTGGSPSPGPTTIYPTGGEQIIASRTGLGLLTLITAGTYAADNSSSTSDPVAPSNSLVTPNAPTAGRWVYAAPGWVFGAGTATVTLNVHVAQNDSAPTHSGLAISCLIYEVASGGGTTLRGTLPTGTTVDGIAGEVALSCSASLAGFTPAAGSHLRFDVSLVVSSPVTFNANPTIGEATGQVIGQSLVVVFGVAPTVPAATTYPNYGSLATLTPRTNSGTGIVWPDTNDPGLAPSGCDENGPNWPAARISIADQTDVLFATMTGTRSQTFMQLWNSLADAANLEHLQVLAAVPDPAHLTDRSHDTLAVATTQKVPFYVSGPTPTPVRTYSNEANPTDGRWTGVVTHHLIDASKIANKVMVFSQNGTNGTVIVSKLRNDSSGLYAWNHIHKTLNRVIQDDAIATQVQADARAKLELDNGNRATSAIEFAVPFDPLIVTGDPINLIVVDRNTNTTLLDGTGDPWFVTSCQSQWADASGTPLSISRVTAAKFVSV